MLLRTFVSFGLVVGSALPHRAASALEASSAYIKIDVRRQCSHARGADVEDYGSWRCKGYAGVALWLSAGDQRMQVSFGPTAAKEMAASETLGPFNSFYEGVIERRLEANHGGKARPFATTVRWSVKRPVDERETSGRVLVVTRVAAGGVCHVGYVDALADANADDLAREIADKHARGFRCGKDKPMILGKWEPGFEFAHSSNN